MSIMGHIDWEYITNLSLLSIGVMAIVFGLLMRTGWAYYLAILLNALNAAVTLYITLSRVLELPISSEIRFLATLYPFITPTLLISLIFFLTIIFSKQVKNCYYTTRVRESEEASKNQRNINLSVTSFCLLFAAPVLSVIIGNSASVSDGSGAAWAATGAYLMILSLPFLTLGSVIVGIKSLQKNENHKWMAAISVTLGSAITMSTVLFVVRLLIKSI